MKRRIALIAVLAALAGLVVYSSGTVLAQSAGGGKREAHPRIRAAITALEAAKAEMKTAAHDFGGHREAALKECDAAIAELRLALQFDRK